MSCPEPRPTILLTLKEVCRRTRLGRTSVYTLQSANRFPKSIKLTERTPRWVEHEIEDFIQKHIQQRTPPTADTATLGEVPKRRHRHAK